MADEGGVVRLERRGPLLTVRLNRPAKLNALDDAVLAELASTVEDLHADESTRVVLLAGEGRAFSAGVDVGAGGPPRTAAADSWAVRRRRAGVWQRLLDRFEALPHVTVGALHGHCIGGAALLAAACDLRVADDTLKVRIPELALGIPLTWGGVPRLVREIGLPLTRDLVMSGRTMGADEALRCGFVQRLAQAGGLDEAVERAVGELLAMPEAPLRMTKAMTAAIGVAHGGAAGWADADLLAWSLAEPEGRAAAASYLESLRPDPAG